MVDLRENSVKPQMVETMLKKYIQALEWNPEIRDRKLENSIVFASKRLSTSLSRRSMAKKTVIIKPSDPFQELPDDSQEVSPNQVIETIEEEPQFVSSEELESEDSEEIKEENPKKFDHDSIKKPSRISLIKMQKMMITKRS